MAARRFFSIVIYLLLAMILAVGAGVAATKYWLLPAIHLWKEPITQLLSQAVGAPVQIGHLQARWNGVSPEFEFEEVAVFNKQGHEVLSIPHVRGRLKLSSLWDLSPHFSQLEVTGLALLISRNEEGTIDLFSQSERGDEIGASQISELKPAVYRWLSQQGQLHMRDSYVVWQDLFTAQPPLALLLEELSLQQHLGHLQVAGVLSSLSHAHTQLQFYSQWQLPDQAAAKPHGSHLAQGQIEVVIRQWQPSAWRRWIDLPSFLYQGTINAHVQLVIQDERLDTVQGTLFIERPFWADGRRLLSIEPQPFFQARSARLYFELNQSALRELAALSADDPLPVFIPGSQWRVQLHDLNVHFPQEFGAPLYFKQISLDLAALQTRALWQIEQLHIDTGAGVVQLEGRVHIDEEDLWLSTVDLHGKGQKIVLSHLYQFFPNSLDADLRSWLEHGLTAGEIEQMTLRWYGPVDDFEYYQERDSGLFELQAQVHDATIDYYPPTADEAGWPAVTHFTGKWYWHNDFMRLEGHQQAQLRLHPERFAVLDQIEMEIGDVYGQADLIVAAQAQLAAEDFLHLWHHSNLAQVLEDTLEVQQLSGSDWLVDLGVQVPLGVSAAEMEHVLQVQGRVLFAGPVELALWPELPPLEQAQGQFNFSEIGIHQVDIQAQWLGGAVRITGGLGAPTEQLYIQAHPNVADIKAFYNLLALGGEGDFALEVRLFLDEQERLVIVAQSDLYGLVLDLPAPLQKAHAHSRWPMQLEWVFVDAAANKNQLYFALQDRLYGLTMLDFKQHQVESLLVRSEPLGEHEQGESSGHITVDVQYAFLDIDAWWNWFDQLGTQGEVPWTWPAQGTIQLRAAEAYVLGLDLAEFSYTHHHLATEQWQAYVHSDQIVGTVEWQQRGSTPYPNGQIQAHFQRFDVLADSSAQAGLQRPRGQHIITQGDLSQASLPKAAKKSPSLALKPNYPPLMDELPAISLQVDELSVAGYALGALSLTGTGESGGGGWRIDHFSLEVDEVMHTEGSGHWLIWGPTPGLRIHWKSNFKDFGAYAEHLGLAGYVEGGQGQLQAQFYWPDVPWRNNIEALQGQVELVLQQGRLQPIQSRSAKLLELLSLQSLSRIARLDFDIGSVLKEGFPFHLIEGALQFEHGWIQTQDYTVFSPIGSLFFEGQTHMLTHHIHAQAQVIPELDVSGAALAAGIVVNPIIGMGALLAQWLLKQPLSKAMSIQYQITGTWDDFEIEEHSVSSITDP